MTRATETMTYWRHPCFPELGLLHARFTQYRYELHTHPTYVIALITAGCERIRIGRHNILAPAGTVAIVNPEEWHDGERGAGDGWTYRTFYPSVPFMTAIAGELGRNRAPVFSCPIVEDSHLARVLAEAHHASAHQDTTKAETSLLVALRGLIVRHGDRTGQAEEIQHSRSQRRFSLYEAFIESELDSELGLQRLAEVTGVTRFQVIRDFNRAIGLTPSTYIRDRRLRRATLLIEQGLPLAEAAIATGFADQSHLCRAFRAAYAITPGTFKRSGR